MTEEAPATEAKAPRRRRVDGPSAELARRREERKARGSVDHSFDKRLSTAGMSLDLDNYTYRWVNDEPGRIQRLQAQEYELVTDEEMNGLEGARHAGVSREGRPMQARLMKKYKPWFKEDQDEKLRESRELVKQLKSGTAKEIVQAQEGAGRENFYAKSNTINEATPTMRSRRGGETYQP